MKNIFDCLFRDYGGHFDHNSLIYPQVFESILLILSEQIDGIRKNRPELPEVKFGFINNSTLGAAAGKHNGQYYIGIHIGTVFIVQDLFSRMLSHSEVFPGIGNSENERNTGDRTIFNPQITDARILFLAKPADENITPVDPIRNRYSRGLAKNALLFLGLHEYGHIVFGHLDLFIVERDQDIYTESCEHEKIVLNHIDLQTLELDADIYAINIITQKILHYQKAFESLRPNFPDQNPPSLIEMVEEYALSIYSLYRLFGYDKNSCVLSHPSPGIRQRIALGQFAHYFEQHSEFNEMADLIATLSQVVVKIENAFKKISATEMTNYQIRETLEEYSEKHVSKLLRNWNKVRNMLEKYSYGNLAPPHP